MANAADRTLAKWAVCVVVGAAGLVGVAKLADVDKAEIGRGADLENNHALCTLPDGSEGLTYENGSLCLPNPPLVGTPDTQAQSSETTQFHVGIFFEL